MTQEPMPRLVASDLDGTLLAPDHLGVGQTAARSLEALARAGIPFVPASGRPLSFIAPLLPDLAGPRYVVSANGARVSDVEYPGGELFGCPRLTAEQASTLVEVLDSFDVCYELYRDGECYVREDLFVGFPRSFSPGFGKYLAAHSLVIDDYAHLAARGEIEKVNVSRIEKTDREQLVGALGVVPGISLTSSLSGNIEINAHGASKAGALKLLSEHLGIGSEAVLAFGDSGNDVEMLEWAGISIAVQNGSAAARAAAAWRIPSNSADGVGLALAAMMRGDGLAAVAVEASRKGAA